MLRTRSCANEGSSPSAKISWVSSANRVPSSPRSCRLPREVSWTYPAPPGLMLNAAARPHSALSTSAVV